MAAVTTAPAAERAAAAARVGRVAPACAVRAAPDPRWVVEHERARADARDLLRLWRASRE